MDPVPLATAGPTASRSRLARAALTSIAAASWLLAVWGSTARVLTEGRGAHALGYDDVVYLLVGQQVATATRAMGSLDAFTAWLTPGPHSPLTEFAAMLPPLAGFADAQAVYVLNGVIAGLLLLALSSLVVATWWLRFGLAAVLVASPFGFLLANEYRPDLWFTSLAVLVLVGNVPYRLGRLAPRVLPLEATALLLLGMAVVKPSWLALTAAVSLATLALTVGQSWLLGPGGRRARRPSALRAVVILGAGLAVWYGWLSRHFFEYVLSGALEVEYRLAESRRAAVTDSLRGAEAYLGGGMTLLTILAVAAGAAALAALLLAREKRPIVAALLSAMALPAAAIIGLAATWYSRHPSPFQGLYAYGLIGAFLLVVLGASLHALAEEMPERQQAGLLWAAGVAVPLIAVGAFLGARSQLSYPDFTRLPGAAPLLVGDAIARDCADRGTCPADGDPADILVTMGEDMNSAGVEYYARSAGANITTDNISDDQTQVAPVMATVGDFAYVLVRQEDYPANGLPKNMIQDELLAEMRARDDFTELPIIGPGPAYSLFRNEAG